MSRSSLVPLTLAATIVVATAPIPATAGGTVAIGVSNHGLSLGFGTSGWGLWGSSWGTGGWSVGFSATLSGYGEWVHVGGLGRVWRPWVASGWQPYSHGRWVWTTLGWTWVAYEPWGWIPHHYGNWAFTTIGWVWTPGYAYHPGNVVWVSSGPYYGWYPCGPPGWSHSQRAYHHGWRDGYAWGHNDGYRRGYDDGWRDARYATWVPRNRVTADNVAHHSVGHEVATRSAARSRVTPKASPPTKSEIERMVGRSVPVARIDERSVTVDGHQLRVVRPEGQSETVRRHGSGTVKTALAPAARERVVGGESPPVRGEGFADAQSHRRARSVSPVKPKIEQRSPTMAGSRRAPVERSPGIERGASGHRSATPIPKQTASRSHEVNPPLKTRERSGKISTARHTDRPSRAPGVSAARSKATATRTPPPSTKRATATRGGARGPTEKTAAVRVRRPEHQREPVKPEKSRQRGRRSRN